jgi:hypothetical protein
MALHALYQVSVMIPLSRFARYPWSQLAEVINYDSSFLIFSVFAFIIFLVPRNLFAKPRPADNSPLPT